LGQLSTAADEYLFRFGFADPSNAGAAVTDGAYFEYDRLNSVNWRYVTSNNTSRTINTSSTAVDTNFVRLGVKVNTSLQAEFYINGTLIDTISTNIPSGAGRETNVGLQLFRQASGTNTTIKLITIDYMAYDLQLSTAR
jgi:hypothetical protein